MAVDPTGSSSYSHRRAHSGEQDRVPRALEPLVQGSTHLTAWSWRLRPEQERWTSSQVRPWSSRLRRAGRGTRMGDGAQTPSQARDSGL